MGHVKKAGKRVCRVTEDFLMQDYGITASDLKDLEQMQKLLGDPRVRIEVVPTTECHSSMMAMLAGDRP